MAVEQRACAAHVGEYEIRDTRIGSCARAALVQYLAPEHGERGVAETARMNCVYVWDCGNRCDRTRYEFGVRRGVHCAVRRACDMRSKRPGREHGRGVPCAQSRTRSVFGHHACGVRVYVCVYVRN